MRLIAVLTTTFGIGQAAGPAFAAWLAARTGGFDLPLVVGAAAGAVALACMLVRRPRHDGASPSSEASSTNPGQQPSRLCERHP